MKNFLRVAIGPSTNGFRRYWLALCVTMFGTFAGAVALGVRLFDQTHSATYASLVYLAEFLPIVVIGLFLGRSLDRRRPIATLVVVEGIAAIGWLVLVVVDRPPIVIAIAFATGACAGIYKVVSTTATSLLVDEDELDAANASTVSIDNAATLIGYAAGGALIGATSPELVLGLNAITFLISAGLLATLPRIPAQLTDQPVEERFLDRVTLGARRMWADRLLRVSLLSLPLATAAIGFTNSLEIPYLRGVAGLGTFSIGLILAAQSIGVVIGAYITPFLPRRLWVFVAALLMLGLPLVVVIQTRDVTVIIGAVFLIGLANAVLLVRNRGFLQTQTATHERSSVIAFFYVATYSLGALGAAVAGPFADRTSVITGIVVGICLYGLAAIGGAVASLSAVAEPAIVGEP